jgi:transposase
VAKRIRGLLASQGLRVGGAGELRPARLAALRRWDGTPLGPGLLGRLSRDCELLAHVQQRVRGMEAARQAALTAPTADRAVVQAQRLARLKGIGASGWDLVHECFGWRVFANRREVAGLVGLTPTPYDSGGEHHEQGISKAGNQRLRRLTVQLAWSWVRYQPQSRLAQWYQERFARAGGRARKIGIVAVARRLVIDLWRYLEYGVLPGGAVLKA